MSFVVQAKPDWQCLHFISDLHLHPGMPHTRHAFFHALQQAQQQADALFILGDWFDAWVGDDARHDPFEAEIVVAMQQCAQNTTLFLMQGNRDFLLNEVMAQACGAHLLPDPCVLQAFGTRALLSHGDALCTTDIAYQAFRQQVRSPEWQASFLSKPLDERRAIAAQLRAQSENSKKQRTMSDMDIDKAAALQWLQAAHAEVLIHGHTHQPQAEALDAGHRRIVLSDWDTEPDTKPPRAEILEWTAAGLRRKPAPP